MRKFPKVEGGLTTILVYIPQNRAAVLTLIRSGLGGKAGAGSEREFSVSDENACRRMLGKVECSAQTELLKNQNKVHGTQVHTAKGRVLQKATKQGPRCHIDRAIV